MATKKDQHKAGIPSKPRGQQTGFAGNPDQNREEMKKTPALRGRRKRANKMFGDSSEQHVATDATKPSTNSPSTVVNMGMKKHRKNQA
ncbi:MAG TPA: hypothetical protein VJT69_15310 [Pyrinomonadaceae bacterium]|nr:hypothetical protein [Pyrinomonadaceae bacterium]